MSTRRALPLTLAVILALGLAACQSRTRTAPPAPPAAESGHGLDPVAGEWEAEKAANLRSAPTTASPVVGRLTQGQPVTVLGRAKGTDWIAVTAAGGTAYIRLDLLRLREARQPRGTTTVLPKPVDNDGPRTTAAPRPKIETKPIPAT